MSSVDDEAEVHGEDVPPFTMCPHWVLLADLSPQAKVLWWALAAHVHRRDRRGQVVWPSRLSLAHMLRMTRPQSIDPYLGELEAFGAIAIERVQVARMRVRHRYTVRFKAPASCLSPMTVEEFYDHHSILLDALS